MAKLFSERLKTARNLRNMSQRTLGLKAGIPYSSVGHFESGMRIPTIETLRRLGQALNVSTDYLLGHAPDSTVGGGFGRDYFSSQVTEARRFFLNHNQPPQLTRVLSGGVEHCAPDYLIQRDGFPYFCFEYVLRGRGEVRLNGERHGLQPGRAFFYRPYMPHEIVGDADDRLVKYFVVFSGDRAEVALDTAGLAAGAAVQLLPSNSLVGLFEELIAAGLKAGRGCDALCANLLECLALKLADAIVPIGDDIEAFKTYQKCRRMMADDFLRLATPAEAAAICSIEEADLDRLFQRYGRQSPEQYLLRLKMNYAAESLQKPGARIGAVAAAVGYEDPHGFASAFNTVLGMSPDVFRKQSRAYG